MLEVRIKKTLPGFKLDVECSTSKEILTILGPSGSGKTMTLKCIAGLIKPDEGYIRLNDRVLYDSERGISLPTRQRRVGFVFQNYALFPHLTVNENIAFGIRCQARQVTAGAISKVLGRMHIQELGHRYPNQLSSGQQQRVALARALSLEPEILLLDEPFSALDSHRKEELELELLNLQQSYNGDMLFVTHDVAQGYKLGTRMAVFEAGHIVQCDAKEEVIGSPMNLTVARLTGVKNLFEGSVSRFDEENVWVTLKGLNQDLKIMRRNKSHYDLDQPVTVGIRPEYIRFTEKLGENRVSGTVEQVVEGVASTDCFVNIAGEANQRYSIEARLSKLDVAGIYAGQSIHLCMPPERLAVMADHSLKS